MSDMIVPEPVVIDDIVPPKDSTPHISRGLVWNRATRRAFVFKHDMYYGVNRMRQH